MKFATTRLAITLTAFALLAFQAQAQTTPAPSATTTTPSASAPAVAAAPGATTPRRQRGRRQALVKRFQAANTTADGHLTKAQADTANWKYVSGHFDAIDKDHKGYVTTDDIRSFAQAARVARGAARAAPVSAPAAAKP